MMREAQKRGHQVTACEVPHIQWQKGECVKAHVQDLHLTGQVDAWYEVTASRQAWLKDFDAIIMRKDPPFDSEYFYATHLLSQASAKAPRCSTRHQPFVIILKNWPSWSSPNSLGLLW